MFIFFFIFFLLLTSFFFIGKACLFSLKKFNISDKILSLNITFGLFFVGSFSLIFNFFSGIYNLLFYFIFFLIIISSFIYLLFYKEDLKNLYKNLLIILFSTSIFFFYSLQLPPGYDAGLYHIPHQTFIRNEKIIFGFANINSRFGLTSFYNYLASIFWLKDNFIIVAFLQSTYLIIFFVFLYELLKKKQIYTHIIVLTTLLTMPIWFRYNVKGFSLVDLPHAIFIYLSFILALIILSDKKEVTVNQLFYFILVCVLSFLHKANGLILFPLVVFVFAYVIYKKFINLRSLIFILSIPSCVLILWILRGTIISGCLIYPFEVTCFDFKWFNKNNTIDELYAIQNWARQGFNLLDWSNFINLKILFFIFVSLILVFKYKFFFLSILQKRKKIFIFLFFLIFFYIYTTITPLEGFSTLYSSNKTIETINIIKKEFFIICSSTLLSILLSLLVSNSINNNIDFNLKHNPFVKIIFLFLLIFFMIWFFTAPNPRFAIGIFALFASFCSILFLKKLNFSTNGFLKKIVNYVLILILLKISVFDLFFLSNLSLKTNNIPIPETIERKEFGVIPKNILNDNRCWAVVNCYFYENDIIVQRFSYNYKIFISKNNEKI